MYIYSGTTGFLGGNSYILKVRSRKAVSYTEKRLQKIKDYERHMTSDNINQTPDFMDRHELFKNYLF